MVMRIWKNWNFFTLLMGMHHGAVAMENSLIALKMLNMEYSKGLKACTLTNTCIHISIIFKSQRLKQPKVYIN